MRRPDKLDAADQARLDVLFAAHPRLNPAWDALGELHGLYLADDHKGAMAALDRFADIYATGQIPEFSDTVDAFLAWHAQILDWHRTGRPSNGRIEEPFSGRDVADSMAGGRGSAQFRDRSADERLRLRSPEWDCRAACGEMPASSLDGRRRESALVDRWSAHLAGIEPEHVTAALVRTSGPVAGLGQRRDEDVSRFVAWLRAPADNVIVFEDIGGVRSAATVNRHLAALFGFYDFHARSGGVGVAAELVAWRRGSRVAVVQR